MDDQTPVYTVDEALTCMGFGKFQGFALAYAGLAGVAEAMEIMILSFLGPAVKSEWGISSSEESSITTVVFAGMLVGACSWGLIADNYGRRIGFLGVALVASAAGLLSAFSPNFISLVILRGLVGFGLGCGTVFSSWFLEFVPAPNRGMWMMVFASFWTFGSVSEAALAWIVMPRLNWRWLLALSSTPSFAVLIFLGFIPESPRYLCTHGRITDAHNVLQKIALFNAKDLPCGILISDRTNRLDENFAAEENPLLSSTRNKMSGFKSGFSSFVMLFSSRLIRTTFLLCMLFFGNSFSYYGIVFLASELSSTESKCGSRALLSKDDKDVSAYIDVFITSLAELPGILLAAIIVDRAGRKLSMIIMFILACIFLLPLVTRQSNILTTALLSGARMCSNGTFSVASIFTPEIYPTSMRSTGYGVANSMGRIGGMICPLVAVELVTGCHQTAAIILFEVVIVLSVICILLIPFETKRKELSDTIDELSNSKTAEVVG